MINIQPQIDFVITWLGIVLFIIIAFPVIAYFISFQIKRIISKLKRQTIGELEELLIIEVEKYKTQGTVSSDQINTYTSLIKKVEDSDNYPTKRSFPLPIVLSLLTICVHLTNIISGLLKILV
ncbi:hypothetical protein D3C75_667290 [compost metagenome]